MNVFLIDADNLNSAAWVDEAFCVLEQTEGPLPVRRAYGSAENLKALADVLRAWAVRPFVNMALTKNTTDMALAVDAMELACQANPPQLIVIGSGDADFTPLVVRLRERGIRMVCVSERSKMGREAAPAYDRVILVGPDLADHAAPAVVKPARKPAARAPLVAKVDNSAPAPAKKTTAKKVPRKTKLVVSEAPVLPDILSAGDSVVGRSAEAPTLPPEVLAILEVIPAFKTGQPQALAFVAKALLDAKLRGKNMTATKLLKKFANCFTLLPVEKPTTVIYAVPPALT
jgi:hypothetical protein